MQLQPYFLPASFIVGFLAGYITRKNWFLFRRLFSGKNSTNNAANKQANEKAALKKKTDNESSADKGKIEPSEKPVNRAKLNFHDSRV